ncbi:MAG: hypothetical protein WBA57_13345 [Elainellaceae cyanobacterium]
MSAAVVAVVSINVVLSLLCWWGVSRLLSLGSQISLWTDELDAAASQVSALLNETPQTITLGMIELKTAQKRAQQLYRQAQVAIARLQQLRRVLSLMGTVLMWGRSRGFFSQP